MFRIGVVFISGGPKMAVSLFVASSLSRSRLCSRIQSGAFHTPPGVRGLTFANSQPSEEPDVETTLSGRTPAIIPDDQRPTWNLDEAAAAASLSPRQLRRLVTDKVIPPSCLLQGIGRRLVFVRSRFRNWIETGSPDSNPGGGRRRRNAIPA
jgi:hypothetical protein